VITAKGTPVFIAGANVTERSGWDDATVRSHVIHQRAALSRLRRAPVFHVCVVEGVALGWGTEFLLTCDYRIACPEARFGLPETGLGIVPGAGGTSELWSVVGANQALRLGMTGEQIDGEEARRIGLVEETAASLEAGLERARSLARKVARRSPTAVAAFKRGVLESIGRRDTDRVGIEAMAYDLCLGSGEAARGRAAFKAILAGEDVAWGPKKVLNP
jgi:enoyl-CoA hydratase/carnithine racemase